MPGTNLTRDEAQQRADLVSVDSYRVELDLTQGPKTFNSTSTVKFSAKAGGSTFIDLVAKSVEAVTLNGEALDPAEVFADSRIQLPNLKERNELVVKSTQAYTNTGEGLHRFQDPADGEVYLYSQFEVPDSRQVFAVFEQTDLKATFQFVVTAPARWEVISNQPTPEPTAAGVAGEQADNPGEEIATWEFSPTPIMSSYITAIVAGPYHVVRSELTNAEGRVIPLGVFSRKSLAEHLDANYIFEKTREGFEFFEKEFDYPYPFAKYDQMFVPEYNMGAMENIGAVTFTEAYIFRSKVSDAIKERRVVTILHELAHMWFGDLVTMRWWNDLWLNESFAEYTSTLATAEATEWTECWTTFASSEKSWAYRQDQLPSTHPIVAPIRDLEDVMVNFDGITYAKGASVLKTLVAYVGREKFMRGVSAYFKKHNYSNTELPDLLTELESVSGRDLKAWSAAWLETAGVNTLTPIFEVDADGKFTSFKIEQSFHPDYPTLRPHHIAIGLYSLVDGKLVRTGQVEADVTEALTEVPELVGVAQPDLIIVNDEDLTYAKIRLDERSLKTAVSHLSDCEDSLARAVIWSAIWDATRDALLPAQTFIDAVTQHVHAEDQGTTLRTVLGQFHTAVTLYLPHAKREQGIVAAADALWQLTEGAPAGSDRQFQFLTAFAALTSSEEQLNIVAELLAGDRKLPEFELDTDLRWTLLKALAAGNRAGETEIAAMLKEDTTANGNQYAAQARASIPTAEAKEAAWQNYVATEGVPNAIVRHAGSGFTRSADPELLRPFISVFFANVLEVWNTRSHAIAEEIVEGFYPLPLADDELRDATQKWLDDNADAPAGLRRLISEALSDVERALALHAIG